MTEPDPDAQRVAYTGATQTDWAAQAVLLADAVVHEPGDTVGILDPDQWHATAWDSDRLPPKNLNEARRALNARVTNPDAPDSPEHVGVYDELEG